jgi:hypothetical protein
VAPALSVIVAVYNLERYVARCLSSLQAQSCGDLEVVVVDDGSTDGSEAAAAPFLSDARFRWVRQANGGYGAALARGLSEARGRWVAFVDGDDFVPAAGLSTLLEAAGRSGAELVLGNLKYEAGAPGHPERFIPLDAPGETLLEGPARARLLERAATPCGRLYLRSLFDDPALRMRPGILFGDVGFVPKTLQAARAVHYVPVDTYHYDVGRPGQSIQQTNARVLDVVASLDDMVDYFEQRGALDAWRAPLEAYALRHVLSWLGKVQRLGDMPREEGLARLFSVLDRRFGDGWTGWPLEREVGLRRALLLRGARKWGYRPLAGMWRAREWVDAAEGQLPPGLRAVRAWERLASTLRHGLLDRLTF